MRRSILPSITLAMALLACDPRPTTQTLVRVDAERVTSRRTVRVHVTVWATDDPDSPREDRDVVLQGESAEATFPLTIPLLPRGGDASRTFRVEVTAFDDADTEIPFNDARVISGYVRDQLRVIRVLLQDRCIFGERSRTCGPEETCQDGECVPALVDEPELPIPEAPVLLAPLAGTAFHRTRRPVLTWRAVDVADRYELQLTDECEPGAIASCPFLRATTVDTVEPRHVPEADLAISTAAPVGARWTWRVRACGDAGCGDYSRPRYMLVGRHGHDYDGDGFSDLLVGANGADQAFELRGGPDGLPSAPALPSLRAPGTPGDFGHEIADADLDGDGYWDAVVSDFGTEAGAGRIYVFRGSAAGLALDPSDTLAPTDVGPSAFGNSISLGDVDGDGLMDILVAAYTASAGTGVLGGALYVFEGGEDGTFRTAPWLVVPSPSPQAGGLFGFASALVDLDGDGRDELVGGAPDQDDGEELSGITWIFAGSSPVARATLHMPALERNGYLGRALARAGDLDGDGREDLLVGAPGFGSFVGQLYVVHGAADVSDVAIDTTVLHPAATDNSWFASSIGARGDVDGDGVDEVVVGARRHPVDGRAGEGRAFLFTTTGGELTFERELALPTPQADAAFGDAVSISGDYDGDGFADVVVGAGAADVGGAVFVFRGGASGIGATADRTILPPPGSRAFGAGLAP